MAGTQATTARLVLSAATAVDLMSPRVVSIWADATVAEALAALTQKTFNAAPVIEESGRPIGVVSRADILIHNREQSPLDRAAPDRPNPEPVDPTRVRDIMTPALFSVTGDTEASQVVEQMLTFNVHQLFVVDESQSVIGVISTLDVLRRLRPE